MDITVTSQGDNAAQIKAIIPADTVASVRKSLVNGYVAHARIPGFRPGKAPLSVVEKRYAKDIDAEFTSRMESLVTEEAAKTSGDYKILDILAPTVNQVQADGSFLFEAPAVVIAKIELPQYKGLAITSPSVEVSEAEVTEFLEGLRDNYADFAIVERPATRGDVAVVDFTTSCEGKSVEEVIGKSAGYLDGRKDQWIRIEEDAFLPEFATQLEGSQAGDKKSLSVTIPESFPLADLVGKVVDFEVEVKEVKERQLPDLDDAFAARLMPESTLSDLTERVSQHLARQKEEAAQDSKMDQIATTLIEAAPFTVPAELIERASEDIFRSQLQSAFQSLQGSTDIGAAIETMKAESKAQAEKNLKAHFILQEIAQKEGISVSDEELSMEVYRMAEREKKDFKTFAKSLRKNGQLPGIVQGLVSNKTMTFLVEQATVSPEAPSTETVAEKAPAKKAAAKKTTKKATEAPADTTEA